MYRRGISRRKFLTQASLGMTGTFVTLQSGILRAMLGGGAMLGGTIMGCDGSGSTSGGTGSNNTPAGLLLRDPPEALKNSLGVYEIVVREADINVNGTTATLLTYNGSYPGPTIRASKGETLRIRLTNSLPTTTAKNILGHTRNTTNLHTHGLHVSPMEPADAMTVQLQPGESYDYTYDLSFEEPGHLNFYHPHVHGTVAEQVWGGLAGPLVINDDVTALSGFETHILVLKDLTLNGAEPAPYTSAMEYMRGKEGAMVLVNGQMNPVLPIRPGQVQRWQIVNACTARFFKLGLENHPLNLVGTDGGLLDKPYPLSAILLSPGERIDLLVRADQTGGEFRLLSLPYDRGCGLNQSTLLTLSYGGSAAGDSMPAVVNPAAKRATVDTSSLLRRQLTLSMMMATGYINGQTFVNMGNAATVTSATGTYEIWEVVNRSCMDHPFHQHLNSCQVLAINGGDSTYAALYSTIPAWKDVVIVPRMGSATLLVPVMDYDGMTMFHCHILEHEDIGMLGVWDIRKGT